MPAVRKPSKAWNELSPSYQKRMASNGLNAKNWNTAEGNRLRTKARGHGKTPEHPGRAAKNPERYPEYVGRRVSLQQQVNIRKDRLFSNRHKWREKSAKKAVSDYIKARNDSTKFMERFLAMNEFQIDALIDSIDWAHENDERSKWSFLFYH